MKSNLHLACSGGGFTVYYALGVLKGLIDLGFKFSTGAATSSGCFVVIGALTNQSILDIFVKSQHFQNVVKAFWGFNEKLTTELHGLISDEEYEVLKDNMEVMMTCSRTGNPVTHGNFESKEELIDAIICSCTILGWNSFTPRLFRGQPYQDGLYSGNPPLKEPERSVWIDPALVNQELTYIKYPEVEKQLAYFIGHYSLTEAAGIAYAPVANANMFLRGYMEAYQKASNI